MELHEFKQVVSYSAHERYTLSVRKSRLCLGEGEKASEKWALFPTSKNWTLICLTPENELGNTQDGIVVSHDE